MNYSIIYNWLLGALLFTLFFLGPTIKSITMIPDNGWSWWLYPLLLGVNFIGYTILYLAIWFILWSIHKLYEILFR